MAIHIPMRFRSVLLPLVLASPLAGADPALQELVAQKVAADYASLDAFYQDLHTHPELSLMEERTAAVVARELRAAGCEVVERVGGYGVVGVFKNGPGPTL